LLGHLSDKLVDVLVLGRSESMERGAGPGVGPVGLRDRDDLPQVCRETELAENVAQNLNGSRALLDLGPRVELGDLGTERAFARR
jgi:hypothetical protein